MSRRRAPRRVFAGCSAAALLGVGLLCASVAAQAQTFIGSAVRSRQACDQQENALVAMLVSARNRGVTRQTMLEKAERLPENDGTRMTAIARIEDVYLDPELNGGTLRTYRVAKCLRGVSLRDDRAFADLARERLLACQRGGEEKLRDCAYALVAELGERREAVAEEVMGDQAGKRPATGE